MLDGIQVVLERQHLIDFGLLGLGVLLVLLGGWWLLSGARLHMKEVPVTADG